MPPNNAVEIANLVLALVGVLLAILAFFLTVLGVSAVSWYRRFEKKSKRLDLTISKLESQIKYLGALQAATRTNVIVAANFVLTTVPEMTYTQQLPAQLLHDFEILESIFQDPNVGGHIWDVLTEKYDRDHSRIRFARGLYYLAKHANEPKYLMGASGRRVQHNESVIQLFSTALSEAKANPQLERSIRLRLAQAYRQIGQFEKAETTLLEGYEHVDARTRKLTRWGLAVLKLQKGLAEPNIEQRRHQFRESKDILEELFEETFGWNDSDIAMPFALPSTRDGSIAYYTAKAMWAYRCTFPREHHIHETDKVRMRTATYLALKIYDTIRRGDLRDPYISAIYDCCVAFILAVMRSLEELERTPIRGYELASLETVPEYTKYFEECIRSAKQTLNNLRKVRTIEGPARSIYVESTERLERLDEFDRDLNFISGLYNRPERLFKLFQGESDARL